MPEIPVTPVARRLSDFDFDLPDHLIARYPLSERAASRLFCVDRAQDAFIHRQFSDFVDLLNPNDCLIFNNTRVIPARLFAHKVTGGQVELLIERLLDDKRALVHLRASKKTAIGSLLLLAEGHQLQVVGQVNQLFEVQLLGEPSFMTVLNQVGEMPIPPYFGRASEPLDKLRYQTIYAAHPGAVAAPTAGLHFDEATMAAIQAKGIRIGYVTLHVGAGTFQPVRVETITDHVMHAEWAEVPVSVCALVQSTKAAGGRVIAVGTTSVRCLETAARSGILSPFQGETDIFIYPGYSFKIVDALLTNFHLPQSTLVMLVCAFAGYATMMRAYRVAVAEQYRFLSYGDAMFIY